MASAGIRPADDSRLGEATGAKPLPIPHPWTFALKAQGRAGQDRALLLPDGLLELAPDLVLSVSPSHGPFLHFETPLCAVPFSYVVEVRMLMLITLNA